ncbi:ABC transporter substrate-binding protein [Solirubrobacter soli]|uniref:ABC transporter substrate-binding protein n=1 Tax=Solirubrobacter soli TaxID=363832 RepID=UPI0004299628|nr:ABC transporter substrate-binding protein [Solirubrobacter soli]
MTRALKAPTAVALLAALAAGGCGKAAPSPSSSAAAKSPAELSPATPAATKDAGKITWALYRDVQTLDPIQAFDYPENTVDAALCESLLRQNPDGSLAAGLSALPERPDERTVVFKLNPSATFWDGKPVTAADAVYTLRRAADPKAGGFYPAVFTRVKSIEATDEHTVTIKLSEPDYWLDGELSSMPGIVYEKSYAEAKGKSFGTPAGGTMCSGPFKVDAWKPGSSLSVVRSDGYWDPSRKAKLAGIDFKGVPDEASLTSGLLTGDIDGSYPQAVSTLDQLEASDALTVSEGPSNATDAFVISNLKGVLGDVRVRQALSLAVDRAGYIQTAYKGAAQLPRTLANPGSWGYGKAVFQADWDKLADPARDVTKADRLAQQAGVQGKTLTIGMSSEVPTIAASANALRSAGEAIGLKVEFKAVSAENFINFFTDPKAREGVDGFPTVNYPDAADPALFYNTVVSPDGSQNYSVFADGQINKAMGDARRTADPDARAKLVAQAGDRIMDQLPWIPMAAVHTVLVTRSDLTGAPSSFTYMAGPWAGLLGGR